MILMENALNLRPDFLDQHSYNVGYAFMAAQSFGVEISEAAEILFKIFANIRQRYM